MPTSSLVIGTTATEGGSAGNAGVISGVAMRRSNPSTAHIVFASEAKQPTYH